MTSLTVDPYPCECGCGQMIDPKVDPCPFFKGPACQQLWMSTPDCARPDLWRANQRQMVVWSWGVSHWSWRLVPVFEPITHARAHSGFRGTTLRRLRERWKRSWDETWGPTGPSRWELMDAPRRSWDADLTRLCRQADLEGQRLAVRARQAATGNLCLPPDLDVDDMMRRTGLNDLV